MGLYRGFTGHEHLNREQYSYPFEFNLINMNGRIYDPMIGRMMSPDNYTHDDAGTQGYNRYSYAHNNPLKFTDPDGQNPAVIAGAIIGAAANVIIGAWRGEIKDGWDVLAYAGTGAGIGALAGLTAGASLAATGLSAATLGGGALAGAASGAVGGLQGGVNGVYQLARYGKGSWEEIGRTTAYGVLIGAASGAVVGGAIGGYRQWKNPNPPASVETAPKRIDPTPSSNIAESSDNFIGPRNPATRGYSVEVEDLLFNGVGNTPEGAVNAWGYKNGDIYQAAKGGGNVLRHYTNEAGYKAIMESGELFASTGAKNARYGSGQYLTDLMSNGLSSGQVSRRLFGVPWNGSKVTHFIDINVGGLNTIKNAPFNYLVPGTNSLPIGGRIVNHGVSIFK